MVEKPPHPLVRGGPGGLCWRRSDRRFRARAPASHAELVVLHGLTGQAEYLIDGRVHALRPGSLLWALAGQTHMLLSEVAGFDMRVVLITGGVLSDDLRARPPFPPLSMAEQGAALPPRVLPAAATDELEAIAVAQAAASDDELARIGLRWWLARAWAHWTAAADSPTRSLHPAVTRAAEMVRGAPDRSVGDIARAAGLSKGRLMRLFRQQTGQGIVDYRNAVRIERVEAALRDRPHLTLTTAALDAGFGSYSQFFRAFEAQRGLSPARYFLNRK